jgi:LasA protease
MQIEQRRTRIVGAIAAVSLVLGLALLATSMWLPPESPSRAPDQEARRQASPPPTSGASEPAADSPTVVPEMTRAYPATYAGTPTPNATPPDRPDPTRSQIYVVQTGDTLSGIADAFGCTVDEVAAANGIAPDALWPGQRLTIPVGASQFGPALKLLPDSELVFGPAYIHFHAAEFVSEQGGYLAGYTEEVEGRTRTGAEIVQLVAQRYSVGPRALLALLELRAGWVTDPNPPAETLYYPMGTYEEYREGLFEQLSWTAAELNSGYYGWKYGDWTTVGQADGSRMGIAPGLNAGTAAVQNYLGQVAHGEEWQTLVGPSGFVATYERLFGNPFAYSVDPLLPPGLQQPELRLPWEEGETWYFTGGPHGGWDRGSGWAALDFVPPDELGCQPARTWVTAAAPGLVLRSSHGEVVVDLDGDGYEQSGWVLTYMHVYEQDRVGPGVWLERGQRVGHPSCEGGFADATHLHLARRYNGEWIPAGRAPVPLVLSGWTAHEAAREYDGTLTKGEQVREAGQHTIDELNGLLSDNTPPD